METKVLKPLGIEDKINYPCDAYFKHKTKVKSDNNKSPVTFTFNIGSYLYESLESLQRYLYRDFELRKVYNQSDLLDNYDLIVIEFTKEEYVKHVIKQGGTMSLPPVPATESYISKVYENSLKIKGKIYCEKHKSLVTNVDVKCTCK